MYAAFVACNTYINKFYMTHESFNMHMIGKEVI